MRWSRSSSLLFVYLTSCSPRALTAIGGGSTIIRMAAASSAGPASGGHGKIRFITNRMCPFAQRTWIALEESGLAYDLEEVSLYGAGGKPGWFMKLNPKGQVPVLVVGDDVTAESERTIDAVAALHQGGGSGGAAAAAAEVAWRTRISDMLLPRGKKCVLSGDRAGVEALLESLEPEVVGPFLCGENFGGADISAAPFIQRLESEYGIPESCPRLREWYSNISRRPSVKATIRRSWWWWW